MLMNNTAKTIVIWVLIVVAAIGLYNMVEVRGGPQQKSLNFTEFLNKVKAGEVSEVTIHDSKLIGRLADNEAFRSTIPAGYASVYDELTRQGVRLTIIPPDPNPWLLSSTGLPQFIVLGGLIVWLAISTMILVVVVDLSRLVKRELARNNGTPSGA
jgi:ATP-dependent Zn protease